MTYFRTIVTMTNGLHKSLRLSRDQVAHVVYEMDRFRKSIFREVKKITLNGITLCLNEIISFKFINEYTHEELLTI